MTFTSTLFIGDPHFQINNLNEIDNFISEIKKIIIEKNPNIVIIAGDVLHTHERLHTIVLNKAYEFINELRALKKTYILVGNHDYISNTQFLTSNHWMNAMKNWDNVTIVDKVLVESINGCQFTFVPYVYPGRFTEALETAGLEKCLGSCCIFAHQEFKGCKMGAIISEDGDSWDESYPMVISGHIHSKQKPQKNIYYPGTPMQIAFGESENNIVPCIKFSQTNQPDIEEIKLDLPGKKIIYMDVTELDSFDHKKDEEDKLRITLSGNYEEFKAVKKTKKYKDLLKEGVKLVFKHSKVETTIEDLKSQTSSSDFTTILNNIIISSKDPYLLQAYDNIVNSKKTKLEDIFFL